MEKMFFIIGALSGALSVLLGRVWGARAPRTVDAAIIRDL